MRAFEATRWRRKRVARLEAEAEAQERQGFHLAAAETWAAVSETQRELARIHAARSVLAAWVAVVLAVVSLVLSVVA